MEARLSASPPSRTSGTPPTAWRIAPARSLSSVAELEGRIDVALATARSAEEAALEIGAASLEAAEQARVPPPSPNGRAPPPPTPPNPRARPRRPRRGPPRRRLWLPRPRLRLSPRPPCLIRRPRLQPRLQRLIRPRPPSSVSNRRRAAHRATPSRDHITAFRLRAEKVMIRLQKIEAGAVPGDGPSEVVRLGWRGRCAPTAVLAAEATAGTAPSSVNAPRRARRPR